MAAAMFLRRQTITAVMERTRRRRRTIYAWRKAWRDGGKAALKRKVGVGHSLGLTRAHWQRVSQALKQKPKAVGVRAKAWTLTVLARFLTQVVGRPVNRYMARRILLTLPMWR